MARLSGRCRSPSWGVPWTAVNRALTTTVDYNTSPGELYNTTAPSGGNGTPTYQWQSSTDNSTWSDISGATADSYIPGSLTSTTYFQHQAIDGCGGARVPSNTLTITVNPPLNNSYNENFIHETVVTVPGR